MMQRYALYCFLFLNPFISVSDPVYKSIEFVENKGQWEGPFLYKAVTNKSDIYLEKNGFTFVVGAADNSALVHDVKFGTIPEARLRFHAYKVVFEGANINSAITGTKPQSYYYNYFLGNDPQRWQSGIHPNLAVDYKDIYNHIDLHVASEEGHLKYDFVVQPGANVKAIQLKYTGAEKIRIRNKKLQIVTSVGTVEELEPYAYQYIDGVRKIIACEYQINEDKVSFYLPEGYDKNQTLVIDPKVEFATFTGSTADNFGFTATYDKQGNFYAGGTVNGTGYPKVTGHFQATYRGGGNADGNSYFIDVGISKFNATGTNMIYSTYLGGTENEQPHSMVTDANGNLVVVGRTYSGNYPVQNAVQGSISGGADIFVTKLNAAGTALIGSTYFGGSADDGVNIDAVRTTFGTSLKRSYADDARSEVIMDNAGNVYVAACTKSNNFPIANASQTSLAGIKQDAVAFKLNSNMSATLWSTYMGGSENDAAYVLALNKSQTAIYVAGGTESNVFPIGPTTGLWPNFRGGTTDGFVVKFQNSGNYNRLVGSYIGGSGNATYDQCFGVQVDHDNNVYLMGNTVGGTFPVTSGVYNNAGSSQFVIKLDSNLSTNIYSTVWGSGNSNAINITPVAFLVDTCQNVYISGWGGTLAGGGSSTANLPVKLGSPTPAGILSGSTDNNDFYIIVLSKDAQSLLFGGYYGAGTLGEHVDGGTSRFDEGGVIYQAICGGCGGSSATPTTTGAWSTKNNSSNCNLVALKINLELGAVIADFSVLPNTVVCLGEPINFVNNSKNGTSYEWSFGDGSTSTNANPGSHTYGNPGTYTIRLIAKTNNPSACKVVDTAEINVVVDTNSIDAKFIATVTDSCGPYAVSLVNSSKYGTNPGNASFIWDFGDGNTSTNPNPGSHTYAGKGTYTIRLIMKDPDACNTPDTITQAVTFNPLNVASSFQLADVCFGDTVTLANTSTNAQTYLWKIGAIDSSTEKSPRYYFDTIGSYTIKLYAYNPAACNKIDSVEKTVNVNPSPTADFIYSPTEQDIQTNDSIHFTNKSVDASLFNWNFGDGTGSQLTNPSHFYKRTGYYTVCLYASNKEGCNDTVCRKVYADVRPLADIPNAFSPNGDGKNDILYVRGAAIQSINLRIFNRWGELVFQSTDINKGWDGKKNGKPQEMDAYAFVLSVVFIDETTFQKQGNVTLLR